MMYEAFAILLGIPQTIDSIINIIDHLQKDNNLQVKEQKEIAEIKVQVSQLQSCIKNFSISFKEIVAWKYVHEVTNRVLTDLSDVFTCINGAEDSHDFVEKHFPNKRGDIMRGLRSMNLRGATIPKIHDYRTRQDLFPLLTCLKMTNKEEIDWDEWLINCIDSAEREADKFHGKELYDLLLALYNYSMILNDRADNTIIACITQYNSDVERLKQMMN